MSKQNIKLSIRSVRVSLSLLFTSLILTACHQSSSEITYSSGRAAFKIEEKFLSTATTVEQAEKVNLVSDPSLGPKPVPFGYQNKDWVHFKSYLGRHDELWYFSEPGGTGICIVRSGKVFSCLRQISI